MGQDCSKDGGDTSSQLQSTDLTPQISKIFEPWGCSWNHDVEALEGKPAMHRAAMSGNCTEISTLVARGADVDLVDDSGQSALHLAAMHGQQEAVTGDAQHELSLSSMGPKRRCAPETVPFKLMHARFQTPAGTHAWMRANAMTCPGFTAHGLAERSGHRGIARLIADVEAVEQWCENKAEQGGLDPLGKGRVRKVMSHPKSSEARDCCRNALVLDANSSWASDLHACRPADASTDLLSVMQHTDSTSGAGTTVAGQSSERRDLQLPRAEVVNYLKLPLPLPTAVASVSSASSACAASPCTTEIRLGVNAGPVPSPRKSFKLRDPHHHTFECPEN